MMSLRSKITALCERRGFFAKCFDHNRYNLESSGILVHHNLSTEWFNNVIINKDIQVFPSVSSLAETFKFATKTCSGVVPFGIVQFIQKTRTPSDDFANFFQSDTLLRCWMFLPSSKATQFFHQWQRERRIWWRKFSASPSRYVLSDIKINDDSQNVEIIANYPWDAQLLETITLNGKPSEILNEELIKDSNIKCILSEISSSAMLLNALFDSYDEEKEVLRLHSKLAPYKLSFSIVPESKSSAEELKELALHLCKELRKNNISCLFLPSIYQSPLDSQWKQYDELGIPYNIVVKDITLKTGILNLRNRDTTLMEQVPVADLLPYVEKILKKS